MHLCVSPTAAARASSHTLSGWRPAAAATAAGRAAGSSRMGARKRLSSHLRSACASSAAAPSGAISPEMASRASRSQSGL